MAHLLPIVGHLSKLEDLIKEVIDLGNEEKGKDQGKDGKDR